MAKDGKPCLESLPTEIKREILFYIPDVDTLQALVHASPHFHATYLTDCAKILTLACLYGLLPILFDRLQWVLREARRPEIEITCRHGINDVVLINHFHQIVYGDPFPEYDLLDAFHFLHIKKLSTRWKEFTHLKRLAYKEPFREKNARLWVVDKSPDIHISRGEGRDRIKYKVLRYYCTDAEVERRALDTHSSLTVVPCKQSRSTLRSTKYVIGNPFCDAYYNLNESKMDAESAERKLDGKAVHIGPDDCLGTIWSGSGEEIARRILGA